MSVWTWIVLVTVSYLVGGVPNGFVVARLKGVDIRKVGSGNIGATNVFRSVGKLLGILTFFLDAAKGFVPAYVFPLFAGRFLGFEGGAGLGLLCGMVAVAGHNWPVYLLFKGGKGVATSAGALLAIAPVGVGIGLTVWAVVFLSTRYVSLASIVAAVALPVSGWFIYLEDGVVLPIVLTILAGVVIWRHRGNIGRLVEGKENRFEFGKKGANGPQE